MNGLYFGTKFSLFYHYHWVHLCVTVLATVSKCLACNIAHRILGQIRARRFYCSNITECTCLLLCSQRGASGWLYGTQELGMNGVDAGTKVLLLWTSSCAIFSSLRGELCEVEYSLLFFLLGVSNQTTSENNKSSRVNSSSDKLSCHTNFNQFNVL